MVQALPLCALLSLSMGNSLSGCSAGTIEAMVKKESIAVSVGEGEDKGVGAKHGALLSGV